MYTYGKNLGLAFQIVDDILDFTRSTAELGKPAGSDLRDGNLTAPVLYALPKAPYLHTLIEREFSEEGDLETALNLVRQSGAIEDARNLAKEYAQAALPALEVLPPFRTASSPQPVDGLCPGATVLSCKAKKFRCTAHKSAAVNENQNTETALKCKPIGTSAG